MILRVDTNLDVALPKVAGAAYRKVSQVCTSIQTLLVGRSIMKEVQMRRAKLVSALPFGDPHDPQTEVGPVINEASAERIDDWVQEAMERGARRLVRGPREGAVVPPTLLADAPVSCEVSCNEMGD